MRKERKRASSPTTYFFLNKAPLPDISASTHRKKDFIRDFNFHFKARSYLSRTKQK